MRFTATILMNGSNTFQPYRAGDPLAYDHRTLLDIEAEDEKDALNRAFTIGNRMADDALGRPWSSDVRSVSVGDVIYLSTIREGTILAQPWGYYSVEHVGFNEVGEPASIAYGRQPMNVLGVAR